MKHLERAGIGAAALLVAACPAKLDMRPTPAPPVTSVPDLTPPDDCAAFSTATVMACVSQERINNDVKLLAKPRAPGSPHHDAVRRSCATRFAELGFEVQEQPYGTGTNIIGTKPGFSKPEQHVVLGAHYDQTGQCAGADDNASGVAALLEAARVLAPARFDRTFVVSCWDEGERGQLGSRAHARAARENSADIRLAVSLEAVGFASSAKDTQHVPEGFERLFPDLSLALLDNDHRADFLTVVAESVTEAWAERVVHHASSDRLAVHILTLTERMKVKQRKLHRSDHVSFWDHDYPAMLVTDSGPFRNKRIGCAEGSDDVASLDLQFATRATRATVGTVVEALELR